MGIKACGKKYHLRAKAGKARQPLGAHHIAKLVAAIARFERRVNHIRVAARKRHAAKRIQRVLKRRQQHHARVVAENVFRAVAVVQIKIHNRHALQAVFGDGVHGGHGNIVDKTKACGFVGMGVVPRGADGAKGVFRLLFHHHIHRFDGCACGVSGGGERVAA